MGIHIVLVYVTCYPLEQFLRQLESSAVKDHKVYLHLVIQQEAAKYRDRNLKGFVFRKAIVTR